jgi:hypothetical protein
MTDQDATEVARWGTDDARLEYRRGREAVIGSQLAARRRAAAELSAGSVEIPRDAGFASCEPALFPDVTAVVSRAREVLATADLEKSKSKMHKRFMIKLLGSDAKAVADSSLLRLALHPDVIGVASRYLGLVPILQFVNVYYSSYAGEDLTKSQLYHCDSDDVEQVKVFILCDEVTQQTGPLTFLPPPESAVVRKKVGYRYDMHLPDEQVGDILGGLSAARQAIGPRGTVAFIDTSRCLHYGSRFADRTLTRLIVMFQYITPLAFILPTQYWEGARYRELGNAPGLDDLSRMVLGSA